MGVVSKLVFFGSLVVAVVGVMAVSKLSAYRIESGSMAPDFPVGTIVVTSAAVPAELNRAITFRADGSTVTHVLVGYNADGSLITRGIANGVDDNWQTPVRKHDVLGRVLFQMQLFAPAFWSSMRGIFVMIGGGLIVLAVVLWRLLARLHDHPAGAVADQLKRGAGGKRVGGSAINQL